MIDTVQRVYDLIDARCLSLYKLCQMSGVSYSTVTTTRRRNGQLTVDTIDRICKAIGISMSEFFSEEDKFGKQ